MKFEHSLAFAMDHFGFISEAISAFRFLSTDHGFSCVKIEPTFVRYESTSIFINIYHGRKSSELGVEIGKLSSISGLKENWYTLGEVMDLMGVRERLGFTFFQASTRERVQLLVPKLAEYVRKYARPIFEGNLQIFERLRDLRHKKSEEYRKEILLNQIREEAEKAWHKKNYAKLVELYDSMKNDLTLLEVKKLEYAQKRLHSG